MRLSISHDTTYHYEDQVRTSIQYLRMTPHDSERQQVLSWQLTLPRPVRAQLDPYGNILHVLTLDEPHESIVISASGQVVIDEQREAEHEAQSPLPFLRFTRLTEADEALRAFARQQCAARQDRHGLIDLMHALNAHISYQPGSTVVDTSAAQAFAGGQGSSAQPSAAPQGRTSPIRAAGGVITASLGAAVNPLATRPAIR